MQGIGEELISLYLTQPIGGLTLIKPARKKDLSHYLIFPFPQFKLNFAVNVTLLVMYFSTTNNVKEK